MKTTLCLFLAAATAAADVTITTADNREIRAKEIKIVTVAGALAVDYDHGNLLKCSDIVELNFNPLKPISSPGPQEVRVTLVTGGTIFGTLGDKQVRDGFQLVTPSLGTLELQFHQLSAVRDLAGRAAWPKKDPAVTTSDVIIKRSGDKAEGALLLIEKDRVTYHSTALQREVTIKTEEIAALLLVADLEKAPKIPAELYSILAATDGSTLHGTLVGLADGILEF